MRLPAIFAAMLRERMVCLGLVATGVILVGANMLGIPLWRCAFHEMTGMPCPGCGVTRGLTALVKGRFQDAWHWHPFTPLLAVAALFLVTCSVLPAAQRDRVAAAVEWVERRTAISLVGLCGLMIFGIWRLLFQPQWPQ